jgi:hypothetical protein
MMSNLTNILKKLWNRTTVDTTTGCWLLNGFKDKDGYARIYYSASNLRANRVSAHLFYGMPLNSKLQANHIRECPNRHCWNPSHIYVGTQSENRIDSFMLGHSVMFGNHRNKRNR